jgi:hypothetical protein
MPLFVGRRYRCIAELPPLLMRGLVQWQFADFSTLQSPSDFCGPTNQPINQQATIDTSRTKSTPLQLRPGALLPAAAQTMWLTVDLDNSALHHAGCLRARMLGCHRGGRALQLHNNSAPAADHVFFLVCHKLVHAGGPCLTLLLQATTTRSAAAWTEMHRH